ncbi:CBS domain-containing protein [Carnobacterium viridans]|uniref:Predicted transcriptional regulator containing CBS domains n=1 Tax=Carnobacterium viridans TaxID=174587 RepID=A0A1H1BCK3_9LACT|nr:DRTGG domain-containing protein [Carnobacterium viridans]UDE95839.1 CBS domain-containing protein [Carnobacterium viridans]SDQ49704.1 Predicted transcriptional regulator containing CBS domains [Carnobacterium viridans]
MTTKHDQIITYIETLPVGEKISVRSIAKNLNVSEGTAYRAIKDAQNDGLVSTIQRVGTIRIERKMKETFETLTYGEVVKIIDGDILGGEAGLDKDLSKFIIGAMTEEAMMRYISPGSLMIVGNRENAQKLALECGAAVLITGGFKTNEDIILLANKLNMPVLSTTYDSFTVATLINRAITDQLIKKEIMLVDDIYTKADKTLYLTANQVVLDYRKLNEESHHTRFPVVNKKGRLIGMVTAKDIIGKQDQISIERVMTKNPTFAKTHMSVASVGHLMIWDGLEVMPIVEDDLTLMGIVSRQDVMKAMQSSQRQPQMGDTLSDQINENIEILTTSSEEWTSKIPYYKFKVTPQMTDNVGTLSFGLLSEVISTVTKNTMVVYQKKNAVVEQMSLYYLKLIQLGSEIEIRPSVFEIGRRTAKLDIEVYTDTVLVAKATVVCQLMQRS